jgi:hypothetical protein
MVFSESEVVGGSLDGVMLHRNNANSNEKTTDVKKNLCDAISPPEEGEKSL